MYCRRYAGEHSSPLQSPERARAMIIKEFQKVRLKTGEKAVIVEVLQENKVFLADVEKGEDDFENDEINFNDIASIFIETEAPVESFVTKGRN